MTLTPTASGFSSSAAVPASVSTPPFAALAVDDLPARLGSSTVLDARPFATALAKATLPAVHVRTQDGGSFGGLHDYI